MKSFPSKYVLSLLWLLMVLCYSCDTARQTTTVPSAESQQPEAKPAVVQQKPEQQPLVEAPPELANIVARIDDYVITVQELEERLVRQLYGPEDYVEQIDPLDPKTMLLKVIAEKAMIMDARGKNYLQNERIQSFLKGFEEKELTNLLLQTHLQGEVTVTNSEIDEKIRANPKLNRPRAKATLERGKAGKLVNQLYKQIYEKLHVQKLSDNFPKVIQIRQRLLRQSRESGKAWWVRTKQIREDLTPEEKNIALATYDGGEITLKDWFEALSEYSPPSRPKDLDTTKGVERLLDSAMRRPILAAEAKTRGLDKNEDFLEQFKKLKDRFLLGETLRQKVKDVPGPTEAEIIAYFNENKQVFRIPERLKVDQIWCQDLKTARKVKAKLDNGADFQSVKQKYSLSEEHRPFTIYAGEEGIFFKDLWTGEPNEVVGPVKGVYDGKVRWRVAKILKKTSGQAREYSSDLQNVVKNKMYIERKEAVLDQYRKELLEKYSYQIYPERIRDPLDIP